MPDNLTAISRRKAMMAVKSKDTSPEMRVRRALHGAGYRFRLHPRNLPGTPDIVLPKYRTVVFVHGCFWHGHDCPRGARIPTTNADYWIEKIARNSRRDVLDAKKLSELGWNVVTMWECQLDKSIETLIAGLAEEQERKG